MAQLIGETRSEMTTRTLSKRIHEVIDETKHKHPSLKDYYILFSHKPDQFLCNVIREGIAVSNRCPPKMLGSMCFHVNTQRGLLEALWALPLDLGAGFDHIISDEHSSGAEASLRGLGTNALS